jgi:hypothetical protein
MRATEKVRCVEGHERGRWIGGMDSHAGTDVELGVMLNLAFPRQTIDAALQPALTRARRAAKRSALGVIAPSSLSAIVGAGRHN